MVKNLPAMQETQVQSLGWEDPLEKGMAGYPLQYSCLENSMDRGAWRATVHGVTKSQCKASLDCHFVFFVFLFLGDGLDSCLLYNITNLHP